MVPCRMDLRDNRVRRTKARWDQGPWQIEESPSRAKPVVITLLLLGLAGFLAYMLVDPAFLARLRPEPEPRPTADTAATTETPQQTDAAPRIVLDLNTTSPDSRALALDLDGGGITIVNDPNVSTLFDVDNDGEPELTTWIGGGDAFLVFDRNHNRAVDGVSEFFCSAPLSAESPLIPLSHMDSNGDHMIDSQDQDFVQLMVWRDLDMDGVSTAGELSTLGRAGVSAIALGQNDAPIFFMGEDGSMGGLSDISFSYSDLPEPGDY